MPRIINDRYVLFPNPRQGGMADVYKATDYEKDVQVAVKVFKHDQIEGEILAESFRRETQALKDLKHQNIVELVDSGRDNQTDEHFLVLEWMERDLSSLLQQSSLDGWDSYWEKLAFPILKALAFSHERQLVHRDLKPSNILLTSNGRPKLADFGISKLRGYFRPTVTLREFVSRPFTPPEDDDGSYPYTRDVFSFGVVTLNCLTDIELTNYDCLQTAISNLDVPPEIVDIIERATAVDPAERQRNAEILLTELESIQKRRSHSFSQATRKSTCHLKLTNSAVRKLQDEFQQSEEEIKQALLEDLNLGCAFAKKQGSQDNDKSSDNQYSIYGCSYRYLVAAETDHLVIISAQSFSPATLEQNRERFYQPSLEFRFEKPMMPWEAEETIRALRLSIEEHEANLRESKIEERKQRIFQVWRDILRAKTDWEQKREKALKYIDFSPEGNRIIFRLEELPEDDIAGQSRHIKNSKGFSILGGDVVEVIGDELRLYVRGGRIDQLPNPGELCFDTQLAEIALNRQKGALDAIRYDRAVRSDLRNLLMNPDEIQIPTLERELEFIQSLNESQQEVVKSALGMQDFLLVQGPPGTGKTTFITEVILQTLQQNPDARILLSSQTHVALDNALERIQKRNPALKLLRIGNHEKVAEGVHSLLLEEQMEIWREDAIRKSKSFIDTWSIENGVSKDDLEKSSLFRDLRDILLNIISKRNDLQTRKNEIDENFPLVEHVEKPKVPRQAEKQKVDLKSLKAEWKKRQTEIQKSTSMDQSEGGQQRKIPPERQEEYRYLKDKVEEIEKSAKRLRNEGNRLVKRLEEISQIKFDLSKLTAEDLDSHSKDLLDINVPNAKFLQQLINLQTEWFDQFGRNERFHNPLVKRSQVVAGTCIGISKVHDVEFDLCIVDEASKATATEVLVPMSRSKKWLLVGDPKQLPPFQDEVSRDKEFLDQYELTLDDVQETLFDRLLRVLPDECQKMLATQHRMVEPIGKLISSCFYDGKLESNGPEVDQVLSKVLPKPVTWLTTSKLPKNREERTNSSFNNSTEVTVIFQWLKKLNILAQAEQKKYSIGILSGYAEQLKLLRRSLDTEQDSLQGLSIECNTVDALQGREADIVLYSVTRSNTEGKIGFLRDEARLNVALSRGRIGLLIIGDHQFCRSLSHSPLGNVLRYIEQHSEDCICEDASL